MSYFKCGQMDVDGYYERNIVNDDNDQSNVDASYDESSSKLSFEKRLYMRVAI